MEVWNALRLSKPGGGTYCGERRTGVTVGPVRSERLEYHITSVASGLASLQKSSMDRTANGEDLRHQYCTESSGDERGSITAPSQNDEVVQTSMM